MKKAILFLCSFICMTSMAMKPPVQIGQQKRSAWQIFLSPLRLNIPKPMPQSLCSHNHQENTEDEGENGNQSIRLGYASDFIRDFAQNIIQDPSVDIAVTNDPDQIALAMRHGDDGSRVLIAYQENLADVILFPSDRSMVNKQQFARMIDNLGKQTDNGVVHVGEMIDVLRKTMVDSEIKGITIHEHGHIVYGHVNGMLEEQLERKEISEEIYFAEKRKNERAADDRVYEKGSPRTIMASENFLGKLCALDVMTGNTDDTYSTHPHGCKRYAAAHEAVNKILGHWADN
jgi:hypothetical protein